MKFNKFLVTTLFAAGLLLSACSSDGDQGSPTSGGPTSSPTSQPTGTTTSEPTSVPTTSGSSASTKSDTLKSLAELEAVIGHHFHFEYHPNASLTENTFNQEETLKYATDGTYTAAYETYDRLWVNIDGGSSSYGKLTDGKWLTLSTPTIEPVSVAEAAARKTMMQFVDSIEYTSKASTTFLGRNATRYTLEINEGDMRQGAFYQLFSETIIDNETGLALRHISRQSGNTSFRTLPLSFEVSVLNIGVPADAYINSMKEKIDIYDWDTSFFESLGLTSVARPGAKFWGAERKFGTTDDDYIQRVETSFHWHVSKENALVSARQLVEAFYNAGLKYDEHGNMKSVYTDDALYYEDNEEGDITFDAYTIDGHYVDFDLEYRNNAVDGYMDVYLAFYKVA